MTASARRTFAVLAHLLLLLVATTRGAAAQPQVVADFRVDSPSVKRQSSTLEANLRQPVSALVARLGQDKFPYLSWKTAQEAGNVGARLVVVLRDGQAGLCKPPAISLDLAAASGAGELLLAQEAFIAPCDVAALASPEQTYLEKVSNTVTAFFKDKAVLASIQKELLAKIVLTTKIDPDTEHKQVFLPIEPQALRAGLGSTLVAFYGEQGAIGSLDMQPRSVSGTRTWVFLRAFRCGPDVNSGQTGGTDGEQWPSRFEDFLRTCTQEPQVFMTNYEPLGLPPIVSEPGGVEP